MPTYEYECPHCNFHFEEFQKITDLPVAKCPKCGNNARRLISGGIGLIFKGSGFYITDYKKQSLPKQEKREKLQKPEEKKALKEKPS
uniref:Zinc ribbon domain-containing protein n=1 Tax=candidate division WOR-3 bacterium TaxID=2052148 RepID=A0A7C4XJI6_UNCW3